MLSNKIKWVLGISLVFLLILGTNLVDRKNFIQMKDTLNKLYQNRLVTKNTVFEISILTQDKVVAIALSDTKFYEGRNDEVNLEIDELVASYQESELVYKEQRTLDKFLGQMEDLRTMEGLMLENPEEFERLKEENKLADKLYDIEESLRQLSEIQLEEGRRQVFIGRKAVSSIELLTKVEIYLMIFLAILVQVIILYNPNKKRKPDPED